MTVTHTDTGSGFHTIMMITTASKSNKTHNSLARGGPLSCYHWCPEWEYGKIDARDALFGDWNSHHERKEWKQLTGASWFGSRRFVSSCCTDRLGMYLGLGLTWFGIFVKRSYSRPMVSSGLLCYLMCLWVRVVGSIDMMVECGGIDV